MGLKSIFKGKSVLVTGHTGFKGSWLAMWLKALGANVTGVSLEPPTRPSHFEVTDLGGFLDDHRLDIRNGDLLKKFISNLQPDFIFHLAAQALVKKSFEDPVNTYQTNIIGTLNLLEALRILEKKCTVVLITSDKSYKNVEWIWGYRETDQIGGHDTYSASKGACELIISSHVKSFFPINGSVRIATARAGNVIGGGDWAPDRIVPDCVNSWANKKTVKLRDPQATRPWQHVLEPLSGYLVLAAELQQRSELHGEPFNFGPSSHQNHTVLELVKTFSEYWDKVKWENIPVNELEPYESRLLKLNCDKALYYLEWEAVLKFQEAAKLTAEWYRSYHLNSNSIRDLTYSQIHHYEELAKAKKIRWAL